MLEVGNGGMKPDEYRVHMSLWAILAAPLLSGNDLSTMSPETIAILTNRDVDRRGSGSGRQTGRPRVGRRTDGNLVQADGGRIASGRTCSTGIPVR